MPIPVYHTRGGNACGQMALLVKTRHPFGDGRTFPADNVVTLQGTAPIRGSVPVCGACGRIIDSFAELTYETQAVDEQSLIARLWTRFVKH